MGTGTNYIATNGEVKARTGSTASGNPSYGCTNNRAITYGAYPGAYTTNKGNYCVKHDDVFICTSNTETNTSIRINTTPSNSGLKLDISALPVNGAYNVNSLILKQSRDDKVIYNITSAPYTINWDVSCDFKLESTATAGDQAIFYTSTTNTVVNPSSGASWGGRSIVSNTYSNNQGTIVFDGPITTIGSGSFNGCTTLKTIILPSTVTTIGTQVFKDCTSLQNFTVPNNVTVINGSTFAGCTSLTTCTMHNNITILEYNAFDGCSALTSPTSLPTSLTFIGPYCFRNCSALTSMYIPNSVTSILNDAFYECRGLKTFSFGPTVTSLGNRALVFDSRSSTPTTYTMGALTFRGTIAQFHSLYGGVYISSVKYGGCYGVICSNGLLTDEYNGIIYRTSNHATLTPASTTAFYNDTVGTCSITYNKYFSESDIGIIWFSASIDRILGSAFTNKTGYTMMGLNWHVKELANYVFSGCTGLTAVTFGYDPDTPGSSSAFTSIGKECFKNCSSLSHFNFYGYMSDWTNVTLGSSWSSGLAATVVTCLDGDYPLTGTDRITYTSSIRISFNESAFNTTVKSHTFLPNLSTGIGSGTIVFNDDLTTIGANAFNANTYSLCANILAMTLPLTVTSIGNYAFSGCTNLSNINLKVLTNLLSIGTYVFFNCTNLWSTAVPYTIRTQNAGIASSVVSIGNYAFSNCAGMTMFQIPSSGNLTTIGDYVFLLCNALTHVTLPSGLTSIGEGCFYNNQGIASLVIPSNITSLPDMFVSGCTALTNITIPSSVTTFGWYCFNGTSSLLFINYNGTPLQFHNITKGSYWNSNSALVMAICASDEWYLIDDSKIVYRTSNSSVLAPTDTTAFSHTYNNNTYNTSKNIGIMSFSGNLTSIGEIAFLNKSGYTKMLIPKTVLSIGQNAFNSCSGLTALPFHALSFLSLTTIYNYAFYSCTGITSLTFGNNVTTINSNAFRFCSSATSIGIGTGMSSLTDNPFTGCPNIASITVASGNTTYNSSSNSNAIIKTSGNILVSGCKNTIIPSTIKTIGIGAFGTNLTNITTINIPSGVTTIMDSAFGDCTGLTNITLPNTVTTLSNNVFNGCTSLTAFTLSSGLTSIGSNAFTDTEIVAFIFSGNRATFDSSVSKGTSWYGQSGVLVMCSDKWRLLNNRIIAYQTNTDAALAPYSTTVFGATYYTNTYDNTTYSNNAYHYGLIKFSGNVTQCGTNAFYNKTGYTKIYLPSTAVTIGQNAFYGCTGLTILDYGSITGTIGANAFYNCSGLTSLPIPSGVTSIGNLAFYQTHITSVSIPNTVTSIGANVCQNCTYITSATLGTGITTLPSSAFSGCSSMTTLNMSGVVTAYNSYACAGCTSLTTISTGSTIVQYVNATRATNWHNNVPATTVTCSDGTTPIDPNLCYINYQSNNGATVTPVNQPFNLTIINNTYTSGQGTWYFSTDPDEIYHRAFEGCTKLSQITLSTHICTIGENAFYNSGLTEEQIPICYLGPYALYCSRISYHPLYNYGIKPVVKCYDNIEYVMGNAFWYITSLGGRIAPAVADPFAPALLQANDYFNTFGVMYTNINITRIVLEAFKKVTDISEIHFPSTVEIIEANAFNGITKLETVYLPYNLAAIGANAFDGCATLTNMYYPKTINDFNALSFGTGWHANCPNLLYVHCSDGDIYLGTEITYTSSNGLIVGGYVTPFNLPIASNTYTSGTGHMLFGTAPTLVNYRAFYLKTTLTSMVLNNEITSINGEAFNEAGLTSIQLSNALTTIGYSAFCNTNLTTISLPMTLRSINLYAFSNTKLTSLSIPANVTSISIPIVSNVSTLTTLSVNGNNTTYDSRNSCNAIIKTSTNTMIQGCKNSTFPSTVTTIGSGAFVNSYITSINIPNTLTTINADAFTCSVRLTNVSIGSGVSNIGINPFIDCTSLGYITVDSNNATYDSRDNCNAIINTNDNVLIVGSNNAIIPDTVIGIGESAFLGLSITNIVIPDNVTFIGTGAFSNCQNLQNITFYSQIPPEFGSEIFAGDGSLTAIYVPAGTVPDYLAALPEEYADIIQEMLITTRMCYASNNNNPVTPTNPEAFGAAILSNTYDENLGCCVMTFNGTVTSIGENAFYGCSALTGIEIPDTVTSIGDGAFISTSLETVDVTSSITSIGSSAFAESSLTTIKLTNNIQSIGERAFEKTNLTEIIIPNNVNLTAIPVNCFGDCSNLGNVQISNNITDINAGAFIGCSLKNGITLPNNLTSIGDGAFDKTEIESINIPGSVRNIGTNAFARSRIININFENGEQALTFSDGVFYECLNLKSITLPYRTSTASNFYNMFYGCQSLENVNFSLNTENRYDIADYMFYGCIRLNQITLPENIRSICRNAFARCSVLKTVNLPANVTDVGEYAFAGCYALTYVVSESKDSFPTIASNAFSDTPDYIAMISDLNPETSPIPVMDSAQYLSQSTYQAERILNLKTVFGNTEFEQIPLTDKTFRIQLNGKSITDVMENDFAETSLYDIWLPDYAYGTVRSMTASFVSSTIQYIVIPASVISIGNNCFYNCQTLKYVIINKNIQQIGDYVFANCKALSDIYYKGTMEEWTKIKKGDKWAGDPESYCLAEDVHCIDGDVKIEKK